MSIGSVVQAPADWDDIHKTLCGRALERQPHPRMKWVDNVRNTFLGGSEIGSSQSLGRGRYRALMAAAATLRIGGI